MSNVKQVIIVRKDLEMRKGKLASQVAHASMAFLSRSISPNIIRFDKSPEGKDIGAHPVWLDYEQQCWLNGIFTKIIVWVKDEEEFHAVVQAARDAGVVVHPIQDNGLTDFHGQLTWTTAGLGPDTAERLDPITGHLKLVG